ncbi:hypothetical protein D3OALGA1CA_2515 [Olavius algarvensis associated proteobacterium Delta 3]|nr:hypothetical protein D3OALGA1CA_2515 [Olavius algarvensis associated proteobacterium Delta 3]CAB5137491.1 hypothetical protein D3OALGB2SA_4025 [Olavius algarvensis associated proteobacterium Delta 3]
MFFIIGGISPKVKTLDQNPRRCPRCGLNQAFTSRVDHYLNLFFIPLFPVKRGEPVLLCRSCTYTSQDPPFRGGHGYTSRASNCSHCGGDLKADYAYCPFCGKPV